MNSATGFSGLSQIGQLSLTVHDLKRAVEFYRDRLGIKLLFEIPNAAFFDCGGIRLYLSLPEKPEFDHPGSIIYFKTADIHQAFAVLAARGVKFEDQPHLIARLPDHELWMCHFRDADQNVLALMCEIRP
jgi:catechol 2,3-dioxygenase-like lactoylglutathione lyase family enzyme